MIIDFHTHVFPDNIAPKAVATLETLAEKFNIKAAADGTINSLKTSMREANIDYSVTFGVATKPSQVPSINNWAIENNDPNNGIIFFGALHPDYENCIIEIEKLSASKIKGIKLHGEFQKFAVDSDKMFPIYEKLSSKKMFVIFHAGDDLFAGCSGNSSAQRIKNVAQNFPNLKIIAAHGGAFKQWGDSIKYLAGMPNVRIDISFLPGYISDDLWSEILKRYDYRKILLGSDFPWMSQKKVVDWVKSKNLSIEVESAILGNNAEEILINNLNKEEKQ